MIASQKMRKRKKAMADNPHQHNREWFLARRGKLTSSRMHTIVHGGPKAWTTLINKLLEEQASDDILEKDLDFVPAIAHGRKYESVARANVEMDRGFDTTLVGFVTHPVYDFIGCSSDYVLWEPDGPKKRGKKVTGRVVCNGEIKCPYNIDNHRRVYQTGRMPDEHRPQVQCQMFVHDVDTTLFTSYHPNEPHWKMRTVTVEVKRDEPYCAYMLERCQQFMRALRGEAPVVTKAISIPSLF